MLFGREITEDQRHAYIQFRAYHRYMTRERAGLTGNFELDDWLLAEIDINIEYPKQHKEGGEHARQFVSK